MYKYKIKCIAPTTFETYSCYYKDDDLTKFDIIDKYKFNLLQNVTSLPDAAAVITTSLTDADLEVRERLVAVCSAFTEFPTPQLLRAANEAYTSLQIPPQRDEDQQLLPYPPPTTKLEALTTEQLKKIDKWAMEVD